MITPEKIDEWLKEVEQRPGSAVLIIQYIANRLRDLARRNEELVTENIALVTEKKVAEYEQRIEHLEYQLELLKRQLGGETVNLEEMPAHPAPKTARQEAVSILVYDGRGRICRLALPGSAWADGSLVGQVSGLPEPSEPLRLLAVPDSQDLLLIFTSGRAATLPVTRIPLANKAGEIANWGAAPIPNEPNGAEVFACLLPIGRLALADAFIQVSRRGYIKKIRSAMAETILARHYIGAGVRLPADQAFEVLLSAQGNYLALVSHEGYLLCLENRLAPPTIEEAMRLGVSDHLAAAFEFQRNQDLAIMTQVGKLVSLSFDRLEISTSLKLKGQAVFSAPRREKGVRVVGAAATHEGDWGLALHENGSLSLHAMSSLLGSGSIAVHGDLSAFTVYSPEPARKPA